MMNLNNSSGTKLSQDWRKISDPPRTHEMDNSIAAVVVVAAPVAVAVVGTAFSLS